MRYVVLGETLLNPVAHATFGRSVLAPCCSLETTSGTGSAGTSHDGNQFLVSMQW
jgi:hypothetical protein